MRRLDPIVFDSACCQANGCPEEAATGHRHCAYHRQHAPGVPAAAPILIPPAPTTTERGQAIRDHALAYIRANTDQHGRPPTLTAYLASPDAPNLSALYRGAGSWKHLTHLARTP